MRPLHRALLAAYTLKMVRGLNFFHLACLKDLKLTSFFIRANLAAHFAKYLK
jgi:hypothetical protein